MELLDPIFTKRHECQDCHKCIRECPVKAIRVQDGFSQVMPGFCILCGGCVVACPNSAVQVRPDLPLAQALVKSGRKVIASIDPSFIAQFPGITPAQLITGIKRLGFFAVSETALGAQLVSAQIIELFGGKQNQIWISSACPSVVDFIAMYHPECQPNVIDVMAPALAHSKMLRAHYGEDIAVVFFGPCIAIKKNSDLHPEVLNLALTFEDLERWLHQNSIFLADVEGRSSDCFEPELARDGALYAIEGGHISSLRSDPRMQALQFMSFSGIANVQRALKDIPEWEPEHNIFMEMTACAGSCINGPKITSSTSIARRYYDVVQYARKANELPHISSSKAGLDVAWQYAKSPIEMKKYGEFPVREALRWIGQYSAEDELNCGGCGYQSCRDFAYALLSGNAERMMCATYTRKLAQKKANALLRRIPSAVVIVDEDLKIIECNANFTRLFPADETHYDLVNIATAHAALPFANLFRRVLESSEDIVSHDIRSGRRILNTSIFTIEPNTVVGGIFQDITEPTFQKEQIIGRAQQVIEKNLKTVQQIAYLLGENAADSEVILSSIVSSFRPEDADNTRGNE